MSTDTRTRPVPARQRVQRDPSADAASVMADGFAVVAVLALWVFAQVLFLSGLSESRQQVVLFHELRTELAAATAPTGGVIAHGKPVALLTIPALGHELVVVEGTTSEDLLAGPGHRRDTPLPGQEGVSVVYARAKTYGAPFGALTGVRRGDIVTALTQQGSATFVVDGVRRAGDPVPSPLGPGQGRLTLVTAEGTGSMSALAAGSTVIVDASLRSKAFVAAAGRPNAVLPSEKALAADPASLPMLVLCLAAVLAVIVGVVMARRRWSGMLVWVVVVPVVAALSWLTTDVLMGLLPNLL